MTNLIRKKDIIEKMRKEFDEKVRGPAIEENPSDADLSKMDFMRKHMTLDSAFELDYCNQVMLEGLRILPASPQSQYYECTDDVKLGKFKFDKGDLFAVVIEPFSYNPTQWQRPLEFLPERFDHNDPLYLTPDGKKRHSFAMIPFFGGPRICFGKTLAEITMKVSITHFTQMFDFEFDDP